MGKTIFPQYCGGSHIFFFCQKLQEKGSYSGAKLMTDNTNRSQCDSKEEFPRSVNVP